jgi:hypothetical protein
MKRNNWLHVLLLITLFITGIDARAGTNNQRHPFVAYDRGQDTCGQFIDASRLNQQENMTYSIWLAGYITAYNTLNPDTSDIINLQNPRDPSPMAGPMAWIEKYCLDHPMSSFLIAVMAFTDNQHQNGKRK